MLRNTRLSGAGVQVHAEPFAFLIATGMLRLDAQAGLQRDFPRYRQAGFFPYQRSDCGPAVNRLIDELTAPTFVDTLGDLVGIAKMSALPALVTLCSRLHRRHGTIHTDSRSKVVTALVYLESQWPHGSAGCLRFLSRSDDIGSTLAPELPPVFGNLAAFGRADNSFHGHLPFAGQRRVIQIAWLTGENELRRKTRRGRATRWLKRLLGPLDRHIGALRDPDKAHFD
ncbi:MAG: 2OG-Fe(II) oxygenase [Proteobacteria bacterium]|nr:2OG-Fe(II) oxygenase [Pseudomonadota bacterium]MBS0464135.1 2OG-Fe(II) oxygenase [Pseudomonadota bacterium]